MYDYNLISKRDRNCLNLLLQNLSQNIHIKHSTVEGLEVNSGREDCDVYLNT